MLCFSVFDQGDDSAQAKGGFALRHAYLVGADDVPLQAAIRLEGDLIICEKRTPESAGLCLQFRVNAPQGQPGPGPGALMLQTCLLPERERPYLLSLELARHRIMLILNKLEDWAMFDLPTTEPGMLLFERARQAFTKAIVEQGSPAPAQGKAYSETAEQLSREALALAMEAGELLTLAQAKNQFGRRMSGELAAAAAKIAAPTTALTDHEAAESRNTLLGTTGVILPTPPQLGCVVNPEQFTPALQEAAQQCCDFLVMPMRWVDMEPTEGRYLFAKTDRWIEWAVRTARLPLVGGPLIDFRKGSVPEWLYIWEHDYETLRELVYEHVKTLVTRYRRTVGTWTVASGLHVSSNFTLSLEQVMDLTRLTVTVVRKLQPSARVQVQIDQPWGEYFATRSSRAMPPIMYAEMVGQAGINPDLFAIRVDMGQPEPGRATRDFMALSALLDRYAALDRPISLTAVSAPSRPPDPEDLGIAGEADPGYVRTPWSLESQASWMTQALAVAASKPYVHAIAWHELYDQPRPADHRGDGLFDASLTPKPALARMAEIRQAIKNKISPATLGEPVDARV